MATPTSLPSSFTSGQVLTAAQMNNLRGAFRILQVVSTTKSDTFTLTSTTFTDVTGFSLSITPRETTSKIFVVATFTLYTSTVNTTAYARLMRDSTAIAIGDAAGNRARISASGYQDLIGTCAINFLDSPNTTSATTYKLQIASSEAAQTILFNRTSADTDSNARGRYASTITAFEVSA